ncbi:MAG: N-acetylmuramoyl-L-alanine amidase-like domain-containing protein [Mangrovibacterium sp.]
MQLKYILFIGLLWFSQTANAQNSNEELFQQHNSAQAVNASISTNIIHVAKSFLGTPYVANTLEGYVHEQLVVNLSEVDCTTFVECVLAITRSSNYTDFKSELQKIRYRQGQIVDYSSRLHYFSDWLYDNKQLGIIQDIDTNFQQSYYKKIDFMSTHPNSYPALAHNAELTEQMKTIEKQLSARQQYFIPQDEIQANESKLQNGDVVAIVTNIVGLDVVHTGFIIFENGRAHLLHASSKKKKVVISDEPIVDILKLYKSRIGIMVARPVEINN